MQKKFKRYWNSLEQNKGDEEVLEATKEKESHGGPSNPTYMKQKIKEFLKNNWISDFTQHEVAIKHIFLFWYSCCDEQASSTNASVGVGVGVGVGVRHKVSDGVCVVSHGLLGPRKDLTDWHPHASLIGSIGNACDYLSPLEILMVSANYIGLALITWISTNHMFGMCPLDV